jgi:MFS family permease
MLVQAASLWWLTWSRHVTIGWLFALAFAAGILNAFEIPTRQAMIVELVGRDDLHDAIALNSSGFNLARIVGPAVGALVIKVAGLSWCFGVNALSYLAVLGGLAMIHLPARTVGLPDAPALARLVEGGEEAVGHGDRAAGGEVGFAVGGVFAADPGVADADALGGPVDVAPA